MNPLPDWDKEQEELARFCEGEQWTPEQIAKFKEARTQAETPRVKLPRLTPQAHSG